MTVPLSEPNEYKEIWYNAFQTKDVRNKPEAFRWYEPDCTPGPNSSCLGTEPALINSFAQPTGDLEVFAYRHNADSLIQTKGFLDVSAAASGTVAWVMPGITSGELQFIPGTVGNDSFSLRVTTTGDATGITGATAYIDQVTGDVTVNWSSAASGVDYAWIQWGQGSVDFVSGGWHSFDIVEGVSDYFNGFVSNPNDWGLQVELTNGQGGWISWDTPGTYQQPLALIHAWTWVYETNWVAGDVLGIGIQLGIDGGSWTDSLRWVDVITCGSDNGDNLEDQHLSVSAVIHSGFNRNSARAQVLQVSGGTQQYADIGMSVTILRNADGTFYP